MGFPQRTGVSYVSPDGVKYRHVYHPPKQICAGVNEFLSEQEPQQVCVAAFLLTVSEHFLADEPNLTLAHENTHDLRV